MKCSRFFSLRLIAVVQMCAAVLIGLYALGVGMSEARTQDSFGRYRQALQEASKNAKTLEAQLALSPAKFADDGYQSAVTDEHFSTTIFVASIALFISGVIQLSLIHKASASRPVPVDEPPKIHAA